MLDPEASPQDRLTTVERAQAVRELATANARRLDRLKTLIEEESADAAARTAAAPGEERQDTGKADENGTAAETAAPRQVELQRYERAEALRAQAADGLRALQGELEGMDAGGSEPRRGTGARSAAEATLAALDELRRLFFSIVEHLQALRADQVDTHDRTAALQVGRTADIDALEANLGLASERQHGHAQLAGTLAATLAEQADAAGATSAGGGTPADSEAGQRYAQAAEEVRKAGGSMTRAAAQLAQATRRAASPVVEPVLVDQMAAVEHLEDALRVLATAADEDRGEEQRTGQQTGQQQAGGEQAANERSAGEQPMSRRQALKRLQAIRDREAERQRARRAAPFAREPVEKDW